MSPPLTSGQRKLLAALDQYGDTSTVRRIAYEHDRLGGYDLIFAAFKRLERRGFVTRDDRRPARWAVTETGREALR